jgi:hypothetical protein
MPVGAILTDAQSRADQDIGIGAESGRRRRGRIAWIATDAVALAALAIAGFLFISPIWRSAASRGLTPRGHGNIACSAGFPDRL